MSPKRGALAHYAVLRAKSILDAREIPTPPRGRRPCVWCLRMVDRETVMTHRVTNCGAIQCLNEELRYTHGLPNASADAIYELESEIEAVFDAVEKRKPKPSKRPKAHKVIRDDRLT